MKYLYTLIIYLSFSFITCTDDKARKTEYYDEDDTAKTLTALNFRRQGGDEVVNDTESGSGSGDDENAKIRFSRTTPFRISFKEDCDYLAYYCMKAYQTGKVCGRTYYYMYHDFASYCMLDYVNCMERQEVWQLTHMGECFQIKPLEIYKHYPYENDYFLDQYYLLEDKAK